MKYDSKFKESDNGTKTTSAMSGSVDHTVSQFCIVMEYMGIDLNSLLTHKIDFSEQHLIKIVYNTLCSLNFLHEANIMHRDLKTANILITSDCNTKICDFGLSRSIPQPVMDHTGFNTMYIRDLANSIYENGTNKEYNMQKFIASSLIRDRNRRKNMKRCMSVHVCSRWYRAPEVSLVERQYDQSSDLWSFGCIIYELL